MSKMKILVLSNFLREEYGSGYRIRYLTAEMLARNSNIDVTMISPSVRSFSFSCKQVKLNFRVIETPGILPVRFRRGGFSLGDLIFKTLNILRSKYDIIHVDMAHRPSGFIPAFSGRTIHKSIIICEWWDWYGQGGFADSRNGGGIQRLIALYDSFLELKITKKYDGVIAITNVLKQHLSFTDLYEKTIVLYGGAEVSNLNSTAIKEARSALGLPPDGIIIGMVNICEEDEEDNFLFFNAFARLANEYDRLMLLVTGKHNYICNTLMSRIPFGDRIIYPGWVDYEQYGLYLSSCDFFVLPLRDSLRNAARWPNKISDYFVINRPVLTSPVGDLKYLFERYRLGLLCSASADSFYEKAKQFIESKELKKSCCSDQWEFAHNKLNFDNRVIKIHEFYTNLLSK